MIVGKAIKKYNIPREKLVILTKCCGVVNDDPYGENTVINPTLDKTRDYVNKRGSGVFRASC